MSYKREKRPSTVHLHENGIYISFEQFIKAWNEYGTNQIKELPFKRDMRYWNDSTDSPWTMRPKKCIALMTYDRIEKKYVCLGVYEIWERGDGFGQDVYFFPTMEDYNNYNPSQESPQNIKKEVGIADKNA